LNNWEVPEHVRERIAGPREGRLSFDVLPVNWETLMLFLAASTQWRMAPNGQLMGLDYASVDVVAKRLNLTSGPEQWQGLMIMETEIIRI